ncbi:MAG: hypothetical protein V1708_01235 [Candidatus Micrarchaeota archaeon]
MIERVGGGSVDLRYSQSLRNAKFRDKIDLVHGHQFRLILAPEAKSALVHVLAGGEDASQCVEAEKEFERNARLKGKITFLPINAVGKFDHEYGPGGKMRPPMHPITRRRMHSAPAYSIFIHSDMPFDALPRALDILNHFVSKNTEIPPSQVQLKGSALKRDGTRFFFNDMLDHLLREMHK